MSKRLPTLLAALTILATSSTLAFANNTTTTGSASGSATTTTADTSSTNPTTSTANDLACMQTAVEKRDNAIIASFDAYSASIKTALTTRRDALKAAWGITDAKARREAIKKAWSNFKDAHKAARKLQKEAREAAWKQFSTERKACKVKVQAEERGRGGDENL